MANFNSLKQEIDQNVNTNGQQAITGAILNKTLKDMVDDIDQKKQDTLVAGQNITISGNVISATGGSGQAYSAGKGIDIDGNNVISVDASDLAGSGLEVDEFGALKTDPSVVQGKLTAGANIQISGNTISATDTNTTYSAGSGLNLNGTTFSADTSVLATKSDLSGKQDTLIFNLPININGGNSIELLYGEGLTMGAGDALVASLGNGLQFDANDAIEVDTNTVATQQDLATKQDTLTAGDGLDIDANNEISVKAGSGLGFDANGYLINTGGGGSGTVYVAGAGIEIDQNDAINVLYGSGLTLNGNNELEVDPASITGVYLPLEGGTLQADPNDTQTELNVDSPDNHAHVYIHSEEAGTGGVDSVASIEVQDPNGSAIYGSDGITFAGEKISFPSNGPAIFATDADLANYLSLGGGTLQTFVPGSEDTELTVMDGYSEDYVKIVAPDTPGETPHIEIFENGSGDTKFFYDHIERGSQVSIDLPSSSGTIALTSDIPNLVYNAGDGIDIDGNNNISVKAGSGLGFDANGYLINTGGGGQALSAGTGIDITSGVISVDANDLDGNGLTVDANGALAVDTTTIQEKLVAGSNIQISGNVISATGGGGGGNYLPLTGGTLEGAAPLPGESYDSTNLLINGPSGLGTIELNVSESNLNDPGNETSESTIILSDTSGSIIISTTGILDQNTGYTMNYPTLSGNTTVATMEDVLWTPGSGSRSALGPGCIKPGEPGFNDNATATGSGSVNISRFGDVSGSYSLVGGNNGTVSGGSSISFGNGNTVAGGDSIAVGTSCRISNTTDTSGYISGNSAAFGIGCQTDGPCSLAAGNAAHAGIAFSTAIGTGVETTNEDEVAIGIFNLSTTSSARDGDATFFSLGNGTGTGQVPRTNVFEIKKNSDVYLDGIGGFTGTNYLQADTLQDVINGKQDTLTAGTGIQIQNNVISATGGGGGTSFTPGDGLELDQNDNLNVLYGSGLQVNGNNELEVDSSSITGFLPLTGGALQETDPNLDSTALQLDSPTGSVYANLNAQDEAGDIGTSYLDLLGDDSNASAGDTYGVYIENKGNIEVAYLDENGNDDTATLVLPQTSGTLATLNDIPSASSLAGDGLQDNGNDQLEVVIGDGLQFNQGALEVLLGSGLQFDSNGAIETTGGGSGTAYTAGNGIDITGSTISVDETYLDSVYLPILGGSLENTANHTDLRVDAPNAESDNFVDILSPGTGVPSVELGTDTNTQGDVESLKFKGDGDINIKYVGDNTTYTLSFPTLTQNDTIATLSDIQSAGGYSAGNGIDITSGTISVDTSVVATQSDLSGYLPLSGGTLSEDPNNSSRTTLLVESPSQYATAAIETVDLDPGNTAESMAKITLSDYDSSNNQQSAVYYSTGIGTGNYMLSFPTLSQNETIATLSDISGGSSYSAGTGISISAQNVISNTAPDPGFWVAGSGIGSLKFNRSTGASGMYSIAIGEGVDVNGAYTCGVGYNSKVYGSNLYSTAISGGQVGRINSSGASYAVAIGNGAFCTASEAMALGVGARAFNPGEISIGYYANSIDSGTNAEKTHFTVGNGTSGSSRSNLIEAKKNNDIYVVGIGGFDGTNAGASGVQTLQTVISNAGGGGSYLPLSGGQLQDTTGLASHTALEITSPSNGADIYLASETMPDPNDPNNDINVAHIDLTDDFGRVSIKGEGFSDGSYTCAWPTLNQDTMFATIDDINGLWTSASGTNSLMSPGAAAGVSSDASGNGAITVGYDSTASGDYSFAQGGASSADGDYSFAANNGTASGDYSAAFGTSGANGDRSFAAGDGSVADAAYSIALGGGNVVYDDSDPYNIIDAQYGVAIGLNSSVSGQNAVAIGQSAVAEQNDAVAIGASSQALGQGSFAAMGGTAQADYSFSFGGNSAAGYSVSFPGTQTNGDYSIAAGEGSITNATNSFAFGSYIAADADNSANFGTYNYTDANILFSVGCGYLDETDPDNPVEVRENAISIDTNGAIYLKGLGGYTGGPVAGCTDLVSFLNSL